MQVLSVVVGWHRHRAVSSMDDVQQASYVMMSTARIAGALGAEFSPYLPAVMPPVLEAASQVGMGRVKNPEVEAVY